MTIRKAEHDEISRYYDPRRLYGFVTIDGRLCPIEYLPNDPEYRYELMAPDGVHKLRRPYDDLMRC